MEGKTSVPERRIVELYALLRNPDYKNCRRFEKFRFGKPYIQIDQHQKQPATAGH